MPLFNDKRVNKKWRRIFRTLYSILALSLVITFFSLDENLEIFIALTGLLAAVAAMVFLWFLYNMPEKLKMQEEIENDI